MRAQLTYLTAISSPTSQKFSSNRFTSKALFLNAKFTLLLFLLSVRSSNFSWACYTCEGPCHDSQNCNCQTNFCQGEFCYAEILPNDGFFNDHEMKYYVRKGCLKKPLQQPGCDYVQTKNHRHCICHATDEKSRYCNSEITDPPRNVTRGSPQVKCLKCRQGHQSCDAVCEGNYCIKDVLTEEEKCGYGTPYLRFLFQSWRLLDNGLSSGRPTCTNVVTGTTWEGQCICDKNGCNRSGPTMSQVTKIREDVTGKGDVENFQSYLDKHQGRHPHDKLYQCFSCDKAGDNVMPTHCQEFSCFGQFCVLVLETHTRQTPNIHRRAGCLNTTRPGAVSLGCTQKWRGREHEVIECACMGNFCNIDLHTAYASSASKSLPLALISSAIAFASKFVYS